MKRKFAAVAALFLLCLLSACRAQNTLHVTVAGRDVAVWKPAGAPPAAGFPLVVFSHGYTGCNTQTTFLMLALAKAGYLVLAPNHKDATCGSARHVGRAFQKPEEPFRDVEKWNDHTYIDRREDMEAILDAALAGQGFEGVPVDTSRVGIAGHSLGGYTALGLAGGWASWKDSRLKAVLALSPHCSPFVVRGQLSKMATAVMYQGGTRDLGETPMVKKTGGAYDQSAKPKYFIELDGAGHFAWTNLNHTYIPTINAYSVAFFNAYLKGEKEELSRLTEGGRPKDISDLRSAP